MTRGLKFASYNSGGLGSGRKEYIRELMSEVDFLLIQEHWLFEKQLERFGAELGRNVRVHGASGMESESLLYGRPYGGVAIAWSENFMGVVTPVEWVSRRLCAVTIKIDSLDHVIILINAYMPTDAQQNLTEFQNTLREIAAVMQAHETPYVVIGGDINTDLSRLQSLNTRALLEFMNEEYLLFALNHEKAEVDYTFESKANGSRSLLDHFMISENVNQRIDAYSVLHKGYNLSDHSSLHLNVNVPYVPRDLPETERRHVDQVCWDKAKPDDIENYRCILEELLNNISIPTEALNCRDHFCNTHRDDIVVFHDRIIEACSDAGKHAIPTATNKPGQPQGIANWNEQVKEYRERAIFWHTIWIENGRPHNGAVADIRRQTRALYHYAVRRVKKDREKSAANNLATKLENKCSKEFWKDVRKIKKGNTVLPNTMDGIEGSEGICKVFGDKFKRVYSSVSYDEDEMDSLMMNMGDGIREKCCNGKCQAGHGISVEEVVAGIKRLKIGKSDSIQGIKTENFIHGGQKLRVMISLLLSSMVSHGCCAGDFAKTTVVPIPKNTRKSMNSSENYRGISLSSVLGKILDYVLLSKYSGVLSSSDKQFGFKAGLSTATCSTVVNEVIDYYTSRDTSVYCVMLDASKAFDRVHYVKLFRLLLRRGLCPLVARFLAVLYTNQKIRVKWGNSMSDEFTARNGVKQGGVLSPVLFSIYLDELLDSLEKSGAGCYIGVNFAGAFAYADDVIILAPTLFALKRMLRVASSFSVEFKISFNASKSKLLVFGDKEGGDILVHFEGVILRPSESEIHLGTVLGESSMKKKIKVGVNDLYNRTNLLLSQFRFASRHVKYRLFKSHCMSLYGYQGWDLSFQGLEDIYVAWRKCVRNLLGLPYRTHCYLLPLLLGDLPIQSQLEKRFVKYFNALFRSKNVYLQLCGKLLVRGSRSSTGGSFNALVSKYGWDRCNLPMVQVMMSDVERRSRNVIAERERIAEQIIELLDMRDRGDIGFLNIEEIGDILHHLCVN